MVSTTGFKVVRNGFRPSTAGMVSPNGSQPTEKKLVAFLYPLKSGGPNFHLFKNMYYVPFVVLQEISHYGNLSIELFEVGLYLSCLSMYGFTQRCFRTSNPPFAKATGGASAIAFALATEAPAAAESWARLRGAFGWGCFASPASGCLPYQRVEIPRTPTPRGW